jgi:heterodisulfide reductase subunit C
MNQSAEVIGAEEIDPRFKYEISRVRGAENIMQCFQCGTCTAGCPVSRFSDFYRPKRIARMIQLGLKSRVLLDRHIWLCTTCYTCIDRCPQSVDIANVIRALRNISIKYTNSMPFVYKFLAETLLKTGELVYEIPGLLTKKRELSGLPPLPRGRPEVIAKIFEVTGLADLLKNVQVFEGVK